MATLQKNRFKIRLFHKALAFASWLANLPNKVTPPPFRVIQIGSAFWQSRALYVAAKLGIADSLADLERDCGELATELSLYEDNLYRLLRMLSSFGVFSETSPRQFRNSKLSNCLRSDHPQSVRDMVIMHNSPEMTMPWIESLEESIRDGSIPFEKTNGDDLFEHMNRNPQFDSLFSQAMDSVEKVAGTDFLNDFNWNGFKRIIDVGGSKGSKTLSILETHSNLSALVFDRPQIIVDAREFWQGKVNQTALDRIEFEGGDLLEAIPASRSNDDIYFFMAVFHTFDNNECRKILNNVHEAMGDYNNYVVIMDAVVDEMNADAMIVSMDMQMLMGTKGRERTISEWKTLFEGTGFIIEEIITARTFAKYIVLRCK